MPELVRSVVVAAPATTTWLAATDWAAQGRWIPATVVQVGAGRGTATRGVESGVGVRLVARTGFGPFRFADPMEITGWDPPRRCEVRHHGRVVRGTGAFEVRSLAGDRSEFIWCEWLELPFGMGHAWAWRLLRPVSEWAVDVALRRFAAWAPSHPGVAD